MVETFDATMPVPLVSVVIPTFNRAMLLRDALVSVAAQDYLRWEVIVVDDGGADDSEAVVRKFRASADQPVRYVRQENRGPAEARNTGVRLAQGRYIAFLDSDDLWLPHHLETCIRALERHPELQWVFGACRVEELATSDVLQASTFYLDDRPRPFLQLPVSVDKGLRIIEGDGALACQLMHGLYAGLQNSVIRRSVLVGLSFWPGLDIGEDRWLLIRFLAAGGRIGYFDTPHTIYRTHPDHLSAARELNPARYLAVQRQLLAGLERIRDEVPLAKRDRSALRQALAATQFWAIGYNGHWLHGQTGLAVQSFLRGLRASGGTRHMWKTFVLVVLRVPFRGRSKSVRADSSTSR